MPKILILDCGTTSLKASLIGSGGPCCEAEREYSLMTHDGLVEVSPDTYLNAIREAVRALGSLEDVCGIAVTTQGETMIPVDRDGTPLLNAIVWLDERANAEADAIRSSLGEEEFYSRTGLPAITSALPLAKLKWLKDRRPEIFKKTYKLLLLEDYLLFWLTGRFVTEKSLQTSTGWFDLHSDDYSDSLLALAGAHRNILPELLECGTAVGPVLPARAAELGFPDGVAAVTAAMDQTAAALAAGCTEEGLISETTGTAMVAAAFTKTLLSKREDGHRVTLYRGIEPGKYLYLPISNTAGMAYRWLRDTLFTGSGYEDLNTLAAQSAPSANGITFLPYLSGEVDPETQPNAKACFYGMTLATNKADLVRAVLESVACQLRDFITLAREAGIPVDRIRSLGGGAQSPFWLQIKSDLCGCTLETLDTAQATSLGAAILASRALDLTPPAARVKDTYHPNTFNSAAYQAAYDRYTALRHAVSKL